MSIFDNHLHRLHENPWDGTSIDLVDQPLAGLVEEFLQDQGQEPSEVIRGYKSMGGGRFTFEHGLGYDYLSADLLGGTADGVRLDAFTKWLNREPPACVRATSGSVSAAKSSW